ncbi:hypothetical protein CC86DRAFT_400099 [Ophiobolus disseminans]|uniref:Uncharacterized protein n=1 Tax=Ophiobolus disseminans TaxID=1469910 RepID=A0A6A7ALD4_9PLEO|nr:hypothetical protein CC86DRAFT_400099 [Ophiobolus disseminans]
MKLHHFTSLLFLTTPFAVAAASSKQKPARNPTIDILLSRAFEMVDLEGECAKQACASLYPFPALCTPARISTFRPQCADIMRNAGMKKHQGRHMAPEAERALEEALGRAGERGKKEGKGIDSGVLEKFMEEEEFDVEKVMGMLRRGRGGQ